ncbi:MAG: FAD-dependent oxidoreductase [Kofleriaceae bacterium]
MEVTVVGAGVIGLSTALACEERGHTVRIVAAESRAQVTSWVAGAVWFPYRAGPPAKVAAWAAHTRGWLEQLARTTPEAGVDVLTGYEITPDATPPWWAAACEIRWVPAPVRDRPGSWTFVAPRCEPAIFVPWLAGQLRATIEHRAVTDLASERGDVVINCTGLGAKALCNDPALQPVQGQILICAPGGVDLATTITDDRDPDQIFYVIPRRDELVVGGIARAWPTTERPPIDDAITARILRQAAALGVPIGEVRRVDTGLRPFRPEVRLERDPHDPRIVHNYGHGGAGFTLSRGCAEDVVALL